MTLWFNTDEVGDFLAYNDDKIAILWYGSDKVWEAEAAPVPTSVMYMVGSTVDALFKLNLDTGVATRVGNSTGFGVGETTPLGLAWDGSKLFMIGASTRALYELDTEDGTATRIGSADRFGVNEGFPSGLAWDGTDLFMVGTHTDALYTVNRTTGVATRIGSATAFGVNETSPSALEWDGTDLFMVGTTRAALYTLDRTTGVATHRGTSTRFGVNESGVSGLGWDGTTLYMFGIRNDALYSLDRDTGIATRIGSADRFGVGEFSPSGMAYAAGVTPTPPTPAKANPPTALTADPEATEVVLAWTAAAVIAGATIDGYDVRYKLASASTWTVLPRITATTRTITGLTMETAYNFEVRTSVSAGTDSDWVSVNATTLGPVPTHGLFATQSGPNLVRWVDRSNGNTRVAFDLSQRIETPVYKDGSIYSVSFADSNLYKTDLTTKATTIVGDMGSAYRNTTKNLVLHNDTLYMFGNNLLFIFTINLDTAAVTRGPRITGTSGESILTGGSDGTNIYLMSQNNLYRLNTSTGVSTLVRALSIQRTDIADTAYDDSKLFSFYAGTDTLITIDKSTAVVTNIGYLGDQGIVGIYYVPEPSTEIHSFTFTPTGDQSVAGFSTTLNEQFTHNGQSYTITRCFTHGNGIQFRFSSNAEALAFIAADFTIDSGISGQQPFKSGIMDNVNPGGQQAAQYRAFPGRFAPNQPVTVTISE